MQQCLSYHHKNNHQINSNPSIELLSVVHHQPGEAIPQSALSRLYPFSFQIGSLPYKGPSSYIPHPFSGPHSYLFSLKMYRINIQERKLIQYKFQNNLQQPSFILQDTAPVHSQFQTMSSYPYHSIFPPFPLLLIFFHLQKTIFQMNVQARSSYPVIFYGFHSKLILICLNHTLLPQFFPFICYEYYSNKKYSMGTCIMICGAAHSSPGEHEKAYIEPDESAKIEEQVKCQPPPPVVKVEEVPTKEDQPQVPHLNERTTLRMSRKSRFFWQKNLQDSGVSPDEGTQVDQIGTLIVAQTILCRRTSKRHKKKHLEDLDWIDESTEKSSSCKRQNNSGNSRQNLDDLLSHKFISVKNKKQLALCDLPATEKDKKLVGIVTITKEIKEKVQYEDGSSYQGEWMNGMRHGKGVYLWSDGSKYDGDWEANNISGNGILTFSDGEYYAGLFKDNQAFGQGQYRSSDGSIYNGGWFNSLQQGQGSELFINGDKYNGMWSKGKKNGYGQFQFDDGSYYKGEFVNNELQGEGEYNWKGQKNYKGSWLHNQKCGQGCMVWTNGERYQGLFQHDKMHGAGRFYDKNGFIFQGNWEMGRRQGLMTEIRPNGDTLTSMWFFNKFVQYIQPKSPAKTQNTSHCSIELII